MVGISPSQQLIKTREITRKGALADSLPLHWSLPLILVFQALLSWLLLQNTAFQDEALYIYAGRQIWQRWLVGTSLPENYSSYFSGYPYVYPPIAGALDILGGLELARSFSLICMLIVTVCGYYVTKRLFDQKSAVFAALFFACQGPTLFLSRLATYDALCLCLLAVGMALAVKAARARNPWLALSPGPFLMLAIGAKYAGLLFIPSILVTLVLCTFLKWGWVSALVRGTLGVASLFVASIAAAMSVAHLDPTALLGIEITTTNRVVILSMARSTLILHIVQMVGLPYAVALASLLFVRKKQVLIAILLLGSALLAPVYHIYKAEMVSLDKHLDFSMFFAMPVAGYAIASLSRFRRAFSPKRYWLSGIAVCLMLFLLGTQEAQTLYSAWPPTTQLTYALDTQIHAGTGRYLVEQFEVSRYNLENDTYGWQWTGLDFFQYKDKQGRSYQGNEAYIQAINAGYFNLIELDYGLHPDAALARAITRSKKYDLIDKIPFQDGYGTGYFWIWRRH